MATQESTVSRLSLVPLYLLAALVMAYGWGYRGIVGHEGGAMVPGALLGLALCLASGRADWYRRSVVAGLCGAVGWAWGGSLSYMEQTMYAVSDSFPDVFYGYAMLFFFGALWAGIGGAILGLAFTLPRSALARLVRPFITLSVAFLAVYLFLFFNHGIRDSYERLVAQHFDDGDFFAAVITLVVCGAHAILRPAERREAMLFVWGAVAWIAGYLCLTKFGGLQLGPPYRSESWGGVLGILITLLVYLVRTRNRAALLLACYGIVGGGLAFALAVFIRHPIRVEWGPFASWGGMMQWKIAEETFGLLMGLAIALGAARLLRGGLASAEEDAPRKPLDVFAVFVVIIALLWMNVRRGPERWLYRYEIITHDPVAGLPPWIWYVIGGLVLSALGVYALRLYGRDQLALAPQTAFGKGSFVLLFLMWATVVTGFAQMLPGGKGEEHPIVDMTFLAFAGAATALLLMLGQPKYTAQTLGVTVSADDSTWCLGRGFQVTCIATPLILVAITGLSMAMQDGPVEGARLRFGEKAYWREAMAVMGHWEVAGLSSQPSGEVEKESDAGIAAIDFMRDRSVIVTQASGESIGDAHRWFHADSRVHLDWYGRVEDHAERATIVLSLAEGKVYVPWPPKGDSAGYLVLKRAP
jgi:hypothetical protein